ncbi:hypothetical protein BG004_004914 [Podila humilis]|nr:hypothetical protein BG004_004914 [Podila humilis]
MADSQESIVHQHPSISYSRDNPQSAQSIVQPYPIHSSQHNNILSQVTQSHLQHDQQQHLQPPNHIRSHSQPDLSPHQQHHIQQQKQLHQQLFDLAVQPDADTDYLQAGASNSRPESPQPSASSLSPAGFDMTKFLDFAVEASSLLEVLHQQGIVHGQLCPTSFSWEESSSNAPGNCSNITSKCNNGSHTDHDQLLTSSIAATNSSPRHSLQGNANSSTNLGNNMSGHPHRKDNHTSPGQLTLDRAGTLAKNTKAVSATPPTRRPRRLSLTLDCTHLGLGERADGGGPRKGLRDHVPPTPEPGSLMDPNLFSPTESSQQVYSTSTVLQDAIAARVARIKRSLLPLASTSLSSSALGHTGHSSLSSISSPAAQHNSSTTVAGSGLGTGMQTPLLRKHFLLHIPQV